MEEKKSDLGKDNFYNAYQEFAGSLNNLSISAKNPIWYPLFLIVGTPSTFTNGNSALGAFSSLTKDLTSVFAPTNGGKTITWVELAQTSAPILESSKFELTNGLISASEIHLGGLLTPFDSKLQKLRETAKDAKVAAENLLPIAGQVPGLLGANESRNYLIAFQNPAEARATGGIIGAYAVVKFQAGKLSIVRVGPNTDLVSADYLPIKVPEEYIELYRNDPAIWQNSNLSPHFPYAAKIWLELWSRSKGAKLDGVLTLDPFVLQQILKETGPIKVGDDIIDATNVIENTMSKAYIKYANDNDARKRYLVAIIKAVLEQISSRPLTPRQLLDAMQGPLSENRILLYSTRASEQQALAKSNLGGTLMTQPDNQFRLIVNNLAGNKMDYYLNRAVTITAISCGKNRVTQFDYTLENIVDKSIKLPPYVNGRLDLQRPNGLGNSTYVEALLFGPNGAKLIGAINNTTSDSAGVQGAELGRPVLATDLELKPKETIHITAKFSGGVGPISNYIQPLVQPMTVKINDKCKK